MNFTIKEATSSNRTDFLKILECWNMQNGFLDFEDKIDYSNYFVAEVNKKIVGMAGFLISSKDMFTTKSLAVYPEFQGTEIGKALQDKRLEKMYNLGCKIVETRVVGLKMKHWYKKNYGYKEMFKSKRAYEGLTKDLVDVLHLDLTNYINNKNSFLEDKNRFIHDNEPNPLSPYQPLIINVALTGVVPTKTLTKYVPISTNEIIEEAIKVFDAGATMVHLHARDENGKMTSDARYYEKIISGIKRERPDLICCATTSGRDGQSVEERAEVLSLTGDAKPDMASLTLGSLNFLSGASVNNIDIVTELAYIMKEKGVKPELEVFDSGMINLAKYLERHDIIFGKKYFNILLGNLNTASATINDLSHIYTSLPQNSTWAAAGLGQFQLPMNMAAIIAGGHVRVGLEDNIHYDINQTKLATNLNLVNRLKRVANELGREISTPQQTKEILGL